MIVFLLWNEHKVQISVNPECTIDRIFHVDAQEFFGFAWTLAQDAKKRGVDPEEDLRERRAKGLWEKAIMNDLGITYEVKEALGLPQEELAEYFKLDPAEMRIFTWIQKDQTETVLENDRSLLSYGATGKPQIRATIGKRPPKMQIATVLDGGHKTLIATDSITGEEHLLAEGDVVDGMTMDAVKSKIRRTVTAERGDKSITEIDIELPSGQTVGQGDGKLRIVEVEPHFQSDYGKDRDVDEAQDGQVGEIWEISVATGSADGPPSEAAAVAGAGPGVAEAPALDADTQSSASHPQKKSIFTGGTGASTTRRTSKLLQAATWADKPAVFLIGSHTCKAGHAGDRQPKVSEPSIKGRLKDTAERTLMLGGAKHLEPYCSAVWSAKCHVGEWCLLTDSMNMHDLNRIWSYTFYEKLAHRPEFSPVLVSLPFLATDHFKQALITALFDDMGFCGCYFVASPVTPMITLDIETGVVVDIGFSNTYIAPIVCGAFMPGMVQRLFAKEDSKQPVGGHYMVQQLMKHMEMQGYQGIGENGDARRQREAMNIFAENCYVAADADDEAFDDPEPVYPEVNDQDAGHWKYCMGNERWDIPECLFQAKSSPKNLHGGLDKVICEAIRLCDVDLRAEMADHIVLAGGVSKLKGLRDRLAKDLPHRNPAMTFQIHEAPDHAHFQGASILASDLKTEAWISDADYMQHGPGIWRLKCVNV